MERTKPPFRAEHVGSLIRPRALIEARVKAEKKEISDAELIFNEINMDGYFLEDDSARAGGFEPLRLLPRDKVAVLGLVTTKSAKLEAKDELKRRIDEASKHAPLEQLALSPQCGFSSGIGGNTMDEEGELAKLRLVVETAREVWGSA